MQCHQTKIKFTTLIPNRTTSVPKATATYRCGQFADNGASKAAVRPHADELGCISSIITQLIGVCIGGCKHFAPGPP